MTAPPCPSQWSRMSSADFDLKTVDALLTTTRSVRQRLDLDRPVDRSTVQECLELAVQAPNADNRQNWRWVVVTDDRLRAAIAERYRAGWHIHLSGAVGTGRRRRWRSDADGAGEAARRSGQWLADNMHLVPVLVLPCVMGRPPGPAKLYPDVSAMGHFERSDLSPARPALLANCLYFGSIFPAMWSLQLALRSRGLGSVITTSHLAYEEDVAALLGIPKVVTQLGLMPVAWSRGTQFSPARRRPTSEVTYWDAWGSVE